MKRKNKTHTHQVLQLRRLQFQKCKWNIYAMEQMSWLWNSCSDESHEIWFSWCFQYFWWWLSGQHNGFQWIMLSSPHWKGEESEDTQKGGKWYNCRFACKTTNILIYPLKPPNLWNLYSRCPLQQEGNIRCFQAPPHAITKRNEKKELKRPKEVDD